MTISWAWGLWAGGHSGILGRGASPGLFCLAGSGSGSGRTEGLLRGVLKGVTMGDRRVGVGAAEAAGLLALGWTGRREGAAGGVSVGPGRWGGYVVVAYGVGFACWSYRDPAEAIARVEEEAGLEGLVWEAGIPPDDCQE